jgi:hypothetical protein
MTVDFKLSDKGTYLLAKCSGTYDRPSMESMLDEVLEMAADRNQPRVLFDFRPMEGDVPISDKYFVTEGLSRLCARYLPEIRFRLVCLGTEQQISRERFVETVFRNRGGTGLVTTDWDEAVTWLQAQTEQE